MNLIDEIATRWANTAVNYDGEASIGDHIRQCIKQALQEYDAALHPTEPIEWTPEEIKAEGFNGRMPTKL